VAIGTSLKEKIVSKLFRTLTLVTALALAAILTLGTAAPIKADTTVTVPYLVTVTIDTSAYDTPSLSGNNLGPIYAGETWFALGSDTTGKWVQIYLDSNNNVWIPATTVALGGIKLPVISGVTGGSLTAAANPTAAPIVVAAGSSVLVSVTRTVDLLDAPVSSANVLGQLVAGQTFYVLGKDASGKWVQVEIISGSLSGWAPASAFALNGITLPVLS
jgi:hypothetical protein